MPRLLSNFLSYQPQRLKRLFLGGAVVVGLVLGGRAIWSPGLTITDGRHDRGKNGFWLQHGWVGADSWFTENEREWKKPLFRSDEKVQELAKLCAQNGITDVFPHLAPTQSDGSIMAVDDRQMKRFLRNTSRLRVLPWIGGPIDSDVTPDLPDRRRKFVASAAALLKRYPQLAGVHLNVEPWPSGHPEMLTLLDELKVALPKGKILSVAAYPPPSRLHPFPEVHWEEAYFKEIAKRVDQMCVMMYDTSLKDPKMFEWLYARWAEGVLEWTKDYDTQVLFGVATYDDADSGYHNPNAENMRTSLRGLHRALSNGGKLPTNYQGAAIYCEWETDEAEWKQWQSEFAK